MTISISTVFSLAIPKLLIYDQDGVFTNNNVLLISFGSIFVSYCIIRDLFDPNLFIGITTIVHSC